MNKRLLTILLVFVALFINAAPYTDNNVPEDFKNDLWLNADYKELAIGETYQIYSRRVPEIINNFATNNITLPEFTFEILDGESVSVDAQGLLTANKLGRALIEVGYNAVSANGIDYAAISPINKAYMVVNVIDKDIKHDIKLKTNIKARTYDTYYFTSGRTFDLSFTVSTENATSKKVFCNGVELQEVSGKYIAPLGNRANVIEVEASNDKGSKRIAQIVDARRLEMNVANITNPGKALRVGDKIHITFKGLVPPIYKLATFYNPTSKGEWGGEWTKIVYDNRQLGKIESNENLTQYDFSNNHTIEITLNEAGEYIFNNGIISSTWWGKALGTEKEFEGKTESSITPELTDQFSKMPAFRLYVLPSEEASEELIVLNAASLKANNEDITYNENDIWEHTYSEATEHKFLSDANFSAQHLPSGQSYGGFSWEGFTLSRSQDNGLDYTDDYVQRQWSSSAGGGLESADDPYLISYFSYYCEYGLKKRSSVIDLKGEDLQTLSGTYICPTSWVVKCITDGVFVARKFVQGDTLALIAHGLDADGNDNGKKVIHYFADYRDAKSENWILQQNWEWMNLEALGAVKGVYFTMESTDSGDFGPNTATYFALDGLSINKASNPSSNENITTKISVYPNPCENIIYIEADNQNIAQIYSLQGQLLIQSSLNNKHSIDLSNLETGIYILRYGETTQKIIVQ